MDSAKYLAIFVQAVLIIAALNWGLVAYNGTDLVQLASAHLGGATTERYAKYAVALAGAYSAYKLVALYA
jgi:uncharacterized membrane protein YuzA (DUF378 family)